MIFMVLALFMLASCGTTKHCPNGGKWRFTNIMNK